MKVLLIDPDSQRAASLIGLLEGQACEVVWREAIEHPEQVVAETGAELIIIEQDSPTRDTLESMRRISDSNPRPIVLFVEKSDRESLKKAIRAGVSAYVVREASRSRVGAIMEVAIARFESHQDEINERQDLSARLARTERKLEERKLVERAKGLVMKKLAVGESEAYALMRQAAMEGRVGLGEIAERVLSTSVPGAGLRRGRI